VPLSRPEAARRLLRPLLAPRYRAPQLPRYHASWSTGPLPGSQDGQDTQTVGNLDEDTRNTYVYKAVRSGGWVVRINGYSMTGREHFFGGKCLGLCLGWTQEKAREVALAWLTRSEIVEE
jgi:hypothetical protein